MKLVIPSEGRKPANPLYDVAFTSDPSFGIRVYRRDSGELVLGNYIIHMYY